jgi:hypothetical protein
VLATKLRHKDVSELETIKYHLTDLCKDVADSPADKYFYWQVTLDEYVKIEK